MHTTVLLSTPLIGDNAPAAVSIAHDGVLLNSDVRFGNDADVQLVEGFLACHSMVGAGEAHVVYTSSTRLRGLLAEAIAAGTFPHLTVRTVITGAALHATWEACAAAHSATRLAFSDATRAHHAHPARLVVATDASMHPRRALAGIGIVTSRGGVSPSTVQAHNIHDAECYAIYQALVKYGHRTDHLVIQTDNRLAFLRLGPQSGTYAYKAGSHGERARETLAQLRRDGVKVSVEWVRGHNGHVLNELADRTAVWARRSAEWALESQRKEFVDKIKAELETALSQETTREELALVA